MQPIKYIKEKVSRMFKPLSEIALTEKEWELGLELYKNPRFNTFLVKLDNSFIANLGEELLNLDETDKKSRRRIGQIKGIIDHYEYRQSIIDLELGKLAKRRNEARMKEVKIEVKKFKTPKTLQDL